MSRPGLLESCHHDGRNNKHCPTSSVSVLVSAPYWPGLVAAVSSKWPPLASSSGAGRDSFPPSWHQQSAAQLLAVFTTASRVPSVVNCVQLSRARLPPAQQRTQHTALYWSELKFHWIALLWRYVPGDSCYNQFSDRCNSVKYERLKWKGQI